MKAKSCACCGAMLEGEYYKVGDNFLQRKYFESEEDSLFCSEECVMKGLSVLLVDEQGNEYEHFG